MNASEQLPSGRWTGSIGCSVVTMITITAMALLASSLGRAGGTVTSCDEASLRAAMAGGGTVTFACDGTIALVNTISNTTDTVLDGNGHLITVSGNNAVRVFYVASNADFTVTHLTIANGSQSSGAGVFNDGGMVTVAYCNFVANHAQGLAGDYVFDENSPPGQDACGGAVYNSGTLKVMNCTFAGNSAWGGNGGCSSGYSKEWWPYLVGYGGGIGGSGCGGAIYNLGLLAINGCTFSSNSVLGGTGGFGGSESGYTYAISGGNGGSGGSGNGSALFNGGSAGVLNSTFLINSAVGGMGGPGGPGSEPVLPGYPFGEGGPGGNGGSGFGVICDTNGQIYFTNCTVAFNSGAGGSGGLGGYAGGPPYNAADNGGAGVGFGGLNTKGANLINTLLASIPADSNCLGSVIDLGHNLSSDASCAFTNAGSMNNTDPKLGPLADNGGPTLTMALLPGSPAIDVGTATGAPATDQRGVPRPQGAGVDIGAFEYIYGPIFTGATVSNATNRQMQLSGLTPNQSLTLQASTNLVNWWNVTNFMAGQNGAFQCIDPMPCDARMRFYRLKSDAP